jgi:cell division protein FtsQ
VSALTRNPFRPDPTLAPPAPVGWPTDPGLRARTGAEFDPLRDHWPVIAPPPLPSEGPSAPPKAATGRIAPRLAGANPLPPSVPALPPEPRPAREVAPSRLAYRLHRLWLTPGLRAFLGRGLPLVLLAGGLALFWSGPERRAMVAGFMAELRATIEARPEFRIDRVEVVTDTPEVAAAVLARLEVALPASSLRIDAADLRARAEQLDAVARAAVTVRTGGADGGVLEVRLTEREPAFVWRHAGGLDLIDSEGRRVARLAARAVRPDLPLIAGDGAAAQVAEARAVIAAAQPIAHRLQGLVRVGERRWDVVLDRDQRILLPANGAVPALERALALDAVQDLFGREISVIDLRHPHRPVLRLTAGAAAELARIRQSNTETRVARR